MIGHMNSVGDPVVSRRRMLQTVSVSILSAAAVGMTSGAGVAQSSNDAVELVEADEDAGFNYPYFLYTPERDEAESELPLLVEPANTGEQSDDFELHRERAEELITRQAPQQIADELTVPALVPVFPRPRSDPVDWSHYTQQLDDVTLSIDSGPLERIDQQLINMIEHARNRLTDQEYPVTDDGVLLNGFSASGTFVDRFTVLHPEEVLSVTAGGLNGMALLPAEEVDGRDVPYHVGLANVEELIGKTPDLDELDTTRQFLYMGGDDENDTIPFDDAWTDDDLRQLALDIYGDDIIEERFAKSEEVYENAGIDAEFRVYEGVGHTPAPAMDDIITFHEETVAEYRVADDETETAGEEVPEEDDETETTDDETDMTDDQAPGFGVGSALAAVGGVGYALKRQLSATDTE